MYFHETTIQDAYQDEARHKFLIHRGTTRLLLSSYAAGINEEKESYSLSIDSSVYCV